MGLDRGREIHGELSSADASARLQIAIHEAGIAPGTLTVGSSEIIVVTDFTVISVPGGVVSIESINATGTLTLFKGTVVANGGAAKALSTPFYGRRGGTLCLTAPAGQVDVQLEGCIIH